MDSTACSTATNHDMEVASQPAVAPSIEHGGEMLSPKQLYSTYWASHTFVTAAQSVSTTWRVGGPPSPSLPPTPSQKNDEEAQPLSL